MAGVMWRPLGKFDRGARSAARIQAHFAAQWLARAARAYIPARPNDDHTNLGWDDRLGGFTTHALPNGTRLALTVADLTLAVVSAAGVVSDALALDGRTERGARGWIGERVVANGLDPSALDAPLPYDMPAHPLATGAAYATRACATALGDLAAWFANADAMLAAIRRQLVEQELLNAPPVRCWPHHFDLDTLVTVAPGRTAGVGFSPGDGYYDEPYFYVSLYPAPDIATLPRLPAIGHWHVKDFTAAIATARRIVDARDQARETEAFVRGAVDAAVKALA